MTAPSPAGLSPLLDQLDEARAKGTPGEWHVASSGGIDAGDYDTVIARGDVDCMAHCYGGTSTLDGDNLAADLALIVAEHNALPELIAELRKRDAAVRAVLDLIDPEAGMATGNGYDATRLFEEKDIRAALTAALTPGADTAGATA